MKLARLSATPDGGRGAGPEGWTLPGSRGAAGSVERLAGPEFKSSPLTFDSIYPLAATSQLVSDKPRPWFVAFLRATRGDPVARTAST